MILDGKEVSLNIKNEIKEKVMKLEMKPKLVVIQVGNDVASGVYINAKSNACLAVGIDFEHIKFENDALSKDIIKTIKRLNKDINTNGILVQLPLPEGFNQEEIINVIDPIKDVDGLTNYNKVALYNNEDSIIPCTPKAIMYLLDFYKKDYVSKNVVVVGKSNLVGKPVSMLLMHAGATVTICHSRTANLKQHTKKADILISAVGSKYLITKDMVKEDSCVIDVGISKIDNKLYGDVDYIEMCSICDVTKVPGGVGPMTVAMLLSNTLQAYYKMNEHLNIV